MSADIGNSLALGLGLQPNDMRAGDQEFFHNEDLVQPPPLVDLYYPGEVPIGDAGGFIGYMNPWWPNSGAFAGDLGVGASPIGLQQGWCPASITPTGCNGRMSFTGITRDQYGSPLGGCTVKLFRTSNDALMSSVFSDVNGQYTITTPYFPDTHYIVVYKTGTPDTFGTTVNTLIAG